MGAIPTWMDGVTSYEEGAGRHEVGIRDIPWDGPDQLEKIVAFTGRKPPKLMILFGEADLLTRCPSYEWERRTGLSVGRWKDQPS